MNKKLQTLTIISIVMLVFVLGGIAARQAPVAEILDYLEDSFVYLPLIANQQATQDVGNNVLYVFSTTTTVAGGDGPGRSGMGAICTAEDPGSHFCNKREVENAIVTTGVVFEHPFPESWVDRVLDLEDTTPNWSNGTCHGWTLSDEGGTTIGENARNIEEGGEDCLNAILVACCKWVP